MILAKTMEGQRVLKDRSVPLSGRQRAVFVLIDGKKSLEELLVATRSAGVTREDIDKLMELKLVSELTKAAAMARDTAVKLEAKRSGKPLEQRYEEAYPIATMLTSSLGLRGYRLNVAVESASNYMELLALAPRIREAVGDERFAMLDRLLND